MATTTRHLDHPPEAVFAVLTDARRYADWVVGARRIRAVDETWPAPGSRFHHEFGVGPLHIDDSTVLEEIDPPRHLVLRARARPTGVARVTIDLVPSPDGGSDLEMTEVPIAGVARRIDNPVLECLVGLRNGRSLQRLADLVGTGSGT